MMISFLIKNKIAFLEFFDQKVYFCSTVRIQYPDVLTFPHSDLMTVQRDFRKSFEVVITLREESLKHQVQFKENARICYTEGLKALEQDSI